MGSSNVEHFYVPKEKIVKRTRLPPKKSYTGNRIYVRFEYEWRDADNPTQWMRTIGNEHWEFDYEGLMSRRDMSANDYPIEESERGYRS